MCLLLALPIDFVSLLLQSVLVCFPQLLTDISLINSSLLLVALQWMEILVVMLNMEVFNHLVFILKVIVIVIQVVRG